MGSVGYAIRALRRSPSFSLALVATLSIAIAANVAVFTVTSALLLKPLPFRDSHRLVLLDATRKDDGSSNGFTLNRYELFRDNSRTLSGVAVAAEESMNLSGSGEPQQVRSGVFPETSSASSECNRSWGERSRKRMQGRAANPSS